MLLRKDDAWNRELDHPDIRNWRVIDSNDQVIGFVESVVVNRPEKSVEAVLTGANDRFSVDEIEVGDKIIRLNKALERRRPRPRPQESGSSTYEDAFRGHFREAFSDDDASYESMIHAYEFGRGMALDADNSGRRYGRAREALRAHWTAARSSPSYERVEEAVQFAYELVQGLGRYRMTGMEREEAQILGGTGRMEDEAERAGAHMTTGRPRSSDEDGVRDRRSG